MIADSVRALSVSGVEVILLEEDLAGRSISMNELVDGMTVIREADLAALFGRYDQVWQW